MEPRDRFLLEQKLMNCWQITDDLNTLSHFISGNTDISVQAQDKLLNMLLGMTELYNLKFEHTMDLFSELVQNGTIKDVRG